MQFYFCIHDNKIQKYFLTVLYYIIQYYNIKIKFGAPTGIRTLDPVITSLHFFQIVVRTLS